MESVQIALWVVVMLVLLALVFDFMNGFHDAANSIATVVSTGVLQAAHGRAVCRLLQLLALFVFQLNVAATVGKGIASPAWSTRMWFLAR